MIWKPLIGVVLGGAVGFAYYKFVGCRSGGCIISGSPWVSTLFGMALGFLASISYK